MKRKRNSIKTIRNLHELQLLKQNIEFREKFYKKEISGVSSDIIDNFFDKMRDFAFEFGAKMITQLFKSKKDI